MTVICDKCGEEWEHDPAWLVECPTCHAPTGKSCVRPSGHRGPAIATHAEREWAALEAGLLTK